MLILVSYAIISHLRSRIAVWEGTIRDRVDNSENAKLIRSASRASHVPVSRMSPGDTAHTGGDPPARRRAAATPEQNANRTRDVHPSRTYSQPVTGTHFTHTRGHPITVGAKIPICQLRCQA